MSVMMNNFQTLHPALYPQSFTRLNFLFWETIILLTNFTHLVLHPHMFPIHRIFFPVFHFTYICGKAIIKDEVKFFLTELEQKLMKEL